MRGRDLFIGVSQPNLVSQDMVRSMAKDPIVLALANPVSEITVAEAYEAGAAVAAGVVVDEPETAGEGLWVLALGVHHLDAAHEAVSEDQGWAFAALAVVHVEAVDAGGGHGPHLLLAQAGEAREVTGQPAIALRTRC